MRQRVRLRSCWFQTEKGGPVARTLLNIEVLIKVRQLWDQQDRKRTRCLIYVPWSSTFPQAGCTSRAAGSKSYGQIPARGQRQLGWPQALGDL